MTVAERKAEIRAMTDAQQLKDTLEVLRQDHVLARRRAGGLLEAHEFDAAKRAVSDAAELLEFAQKRLDEVEPSRVFRVQCPGCHRDFEAKESLLEVVRPKNT